MEQPGALPPAAAGVTEKPMQAHPTPYTFDPQPATPSRVCLRHPELSNVRNVDFDIIGLGRLSMQNCRGKYQLVRLAKLNKLSDWW